LRKSFFQQRKYSVDREIKYEGILISKMVWGTQWVMGLPRNAGEIENWPDIILGCL
jgi:hypothetical protein